MTEAYHEGDDRTVYPIRDAAGNHVADHVREDRPDGTKRCLWRLPNGTWNLNGTPLSDLPLYGTQDVAGWNNGELIVMVEGEKARDALADVGLRALGTVTGAGSMPGEEVLEVLRGRRVVLWPDNDPQGRQHMEKIAEYLQGVAAEVLVYQWDEAPPSGDGADHPAVLSGDPEALDKLLTDLEGAPKWELVTSPGEYPGTSRDHGGATRTTHDPGFNLTDLGNAERLIHRYGDDLRYCYLWNKWLVWDGRRWALDDGGAVELRAKKVVRDIYREAAEAEDDAKRRALSDHARRSEAQARIQAMVALARSEPGVPVRPEELDADPWLFNVENGTLDLRTVRLRPHDRYDLITKMAGGPYDSDAEAPRFERFLKEVFDGDEDLIAFVRRFAGYSLTGSTRERCFAILHGTGKNGKSTLVELLRDVMGGYATNTTAETVLAKTYQGVGNDVAALRGARFVSAAEVEEGRRLAESKVKNLTGSDTVTARFLYSEPFDFRPQFKLWLSTNNRPTIQGTDDAIWDRIRLIPFNERFDGDRADPKLPEKLREELPGVLAWMVRGALEWQESGLGEAAKVRKATAEYREEQDHLGAFIEEMCVIHPQARAGATPLYQTYRAWAEGAGEKPESQTRFGTRLRERGFGKKATPRIVWLGIGLRDDREPDPDRGTKQSKDSLNASEAQNGNPLNGESPIDMRVSGDETKGLNGLKSNIDNSKLPTARVEEFPKKGLEPFNPLNEPAGDEPLPGEEGFDNGATNATDREPDSALLGRVRWAFRQQGRGPEKNLPHFLAGTCSLEILVGSVFFELRIDRSDLGEGESATWFEAVRVVADELRDRSRP